MSTVRVIREIVGGGLPLAGDDIDTDRIIPARYLRTVTFDGLEQHVFEDDRRAAAHPFDNARFAGAAVLVVGKNFGCGSSREHAPQALVRWGIQAVIGESFSDIFFGNAFMIGLPCLTAEPGRVSELIALIEQQPKTHVRVDVASGICKADGLQIAVSLPPNVRDAFVSGAWDTTGLLRESVEAVTAVAEKLPYVSNFVSPVR